MCFELDMFEDVGELVEQGLSPVCDADVGHVCASDVIACNALLSVVGAQPVLLHLLGSHHAINTYEKFKIPLCIHTSYVRKLSVIEVYF